MRLPLSTAMEVLSSDRAQAGRSGAPGDTGDTFWIDEAWRSSPNASLRGSSGALTQNLHSYEKELIETALAESKGKVAGLNGAAVKLGIPPSTLHLKIKQLKIKKRTLR